MTTILQEKSRLLQYVNALLNSKINKYKKEAIIQNNNSTGSQISFEEVECLLSRLEYQESFDSCNSNYRDIDDKEFLTYLAEEKYLTKFSDIARIFNLKSIEIKILLLLTIFEINETYKKVFYFLAGDDSLKYPSINIILYILFDNNDLKRKNIFNLVESKIIQKYSLVELANEPNEDSILNSKLRINPIVLYYIMGTNTLTSDLKDYCAVKKYKNQSQYSDEFLKKAASIKKKQDDKDNIIYFLHGTHGTGKKEHALEIAGYLKKDLIIASTPVLIAGLISGTELKNITDQFKRYIKSIFLYAALHNNVVYFDKFESFFMNEQYNILERIFLDILQDFNILLIAGSSYEWSPGFIDHNLIYIKHIFKKPDYVKSLKLWEEKLATYKINKNGICSLANMFNFSKYELERIINLFHNNIQAGEKANIEKLFDICRENIRAKLKGNAQPVESKYTMADIILPYPQVQQLNDYINYWKNRHQVLDEWGFSKQTSGSGVSALFTGPPGTGKTMAAGIIGNELNLQVYRIDLSQMISKYIGETEKNLQNIFDTAEGGGVLLLFDEADSIFGKRTEVTDSHDRFANIAVSYLLQKIENYDGPIILTTNFFNNIDEAFMRRIQFIIEFSCPDQDQCRKIWQVIFPKKAPVSDNIDYDFLVEKFNFAGGNIRNIAVGSAFYAAEEKSSTIEMRHIVFAIKEELKKTGRIFNPEDFGEYWLKN